MVRKNGALRIREAALALFAQRGVDATTTREIARRAGLAEGTLYRHFEGKDALATALFLEAARALLERLEADLRGSVSAREKLRRLVRGFFRFAVEEPERWRYLMQAHPPLEALPEGVRLPKDLVLAVVREGVEEGRFSVRDPVLGAAIVIGAITRTVFFLQEGLLEGPAEKLADETAELVLRALRASTAKKKRRLSR